MGERKKTRLSPCSFTSNFAKIRSHFALLRHSGQEPQGQHTPSPLGIVGVLDDICEAVISLDQMRLGLPAHLSYEPPCVHAPDAPYQGDLRVYDETVLI